MRYFCETTGGTPFRQWCPAEKVPEPRDRFAELEKQIETLNNNLKALRAETRPLGSVPMAQQHCKDMYARSPIIYT